MAGADLTEWLDQHSGPEFIWYVKRLSGNDTLANKSHQVGPYIPRPQQANNTQSRPLFSALYRFPP